MVFDDIKNAALYYGIHDRIAKALKALQDPEILKRPPGKYEIQGQDIIQEAHNYESKRRDTHIWEAHRKYVDVQYIVSGAEQIGHTPLQNLTVTDPYKEERGDYLLGNITAGRFFVVPAGMFAIFFPHDAHSGGLAVDQPEKVHKIVMKVRFWK